MGGVAEAVLMCNLIPKRPRAVPTHTRCPTWEKFKVNEGRELGKQDSEHPSLTHQQSNPEAIYCWGSS